MTTPDTTWTDPDEAPEWTDEMFERAEIKEGDEPPSTQGNSRP